MMTARETIMLVEDYIGTTGGYLNHFNYNNHDSFYHTYCDLDVDVPAYRAKGLTTRKAFLQILKDSSARDQAKIIRGTFEFIRPPEESDSAENVKRRKAHDHLLAVAVRLEGDGQVEVPTGIESTETVLQALRDAETLLKARGPTSAVDRAHTALHGYVKSVCRKRGLTVPNDPSLTLLFRLIRENFDEFKTVVNHDAEAKRVFGSLASAIDSLNTIRNRATLAHPNELLLDGAEAMLYINLSRAVLAYLDSKLKTKT
jgi:hypothetical protein